MPFSSYIEANKSYVASYRPIDSPRPSKGLAVVTCMDARIDVFAALGLNLGECHVVRNAGARVTDDVIRSLTVSSHALGVTSVLLMQHTGCGLSSFTQQELVSLTGTDMEYLTISDHSESIHRDIAMLKSQPGMAMITSYTGAVFDVETGAIQLVTES